MLANKAWLLNMMDGWQLKFMLRIAAISRLILVPFVIFEHSSLRQKHLLLVDRYWCLILALPRMQAGDRICGRNS
jgi:hypothetical protein